MTQPLSFHHRAGEVANNPSSDVGFDIHRLDCAVDALRGADLSAHREELTRILVNLLDLMEPKQ